MNVLKGKSVQLCDLQLIKFSFIKKFFNIGHKENVKDYGKTITTGKTFLQKGTYLVNGNFQNKRQRDL